VSYDPMPGNASLVQISNLSGAKENPVTLGNNGNNLTIGESGQSSPVPNVETEPTTVEGMEPVERDNEGESTAGSPKGRKTYRGPDPSSKGCGDGGPIVGGGRTQPATKGVQRKTSGTLPPGPSSPKGKENCRESVSALEKLRGKFEAHDIYRLMCSEDLFLAAYHRIKSKTGNMTPGSDSETLDGISLEDIRKTILDLQLDRFQFRPVRRTYIPKANGKTRPLGIPSPRDKIVQEVMRLVLEAIYEGTFKDTSHGFRPSRSCHTALKSLSQ
jgi:hypothetical protein